MPTPAPVYPKLSDLVTQGGTLTFNTASAVTKPDGSHQAFAFGQGVKVRFRSTTGNYEVSLPGEPTQVFNDPADVTGSSGGTVDYDNGTGKFSLITSGLNYTLLGVWQPDSGSMPLYIGVGGVPTLNADIPTHGSATYDVDPGGVITGPAIPGAYYLEGSGATAGLTIDFGAGTVATSVVLSGIDPNLGAFDYGRVTGTGTLAASGPGFAGTMTNAGTGTGEFSGALFGPQGVEAGYAWYFHDTDFDVLGSVAGVNVLPIGFTTVFDGLPTNTEIASLGIAQDGALEALGTGPGVTYDPAAQSVVVGTTEGPLTFGHADISPDAALNLVTFKNTDSATGYTRTVYLSVPSVGGVQLTYARFGNYMITSGPNAVVGEGIFLLGIPTAGGDVPTTGSASYSTAFSAVITGGSLPDFYNTNNYSYGGSSSFTADFLAGTVNLTVDLADAKDPFDDTQPTMDFGTLTGSGAIQSGSSAFGGSLSGAGFAGGFVGAFFGPAAAEMGAMFSADSADFQVTGQVVGIKN
jgi:hypothetical protein